MITLDLSILNQKGTPMFYSDILSARPNFGIAGRIFISTDTYEFYRDTGSAWDLIGGSGTGTITGSGTTGTLSKFTSASTIGDSIVTEGTGFITLTGTNSRFVVGGTDDGSSQLQTYYDGNTRWKFVAASNNAADDADITGYRARGTNATKLAIQSGDSITNYSGRGYDGTLFNGGAGFDIFAAENFSTGNNGTYISVETTPIGSATPTYFHRFSANGGFRVGQNSDPDTGYIFQTSGNAKVSGNIDVVGYGTFLSTLTAANNNSSLSIFSVDTLSYAAGFSSNNIGALYGAIAGFNLQTFAGSATFAQANIASGSASINSIDFSSAGSTITMTQAAGIRAMAANIAQVQYQGTNSGTITHAAIQQNLGFYRPSGASGTLTITNAYSHLINALDDYGAGFTFTNRWGIYQSGASDKNYFAANVLLGSTTDNGNKLQITGSGYFSDKIGIGTSSPTRKLTIEGSGTTFATTGAMIRLDNTTSGRFGTFDFDDSQNLNIWASTDTGNIQFFTNSGSGNNRMVLTSAGRLGVGTSTPVRLVTIFGGANTSRIILQNTATGQAINNGLDITMDGTDAQFWNYQNGSVQFGTNNSERGRFTNGGNLLIGTSTDAGYKLDVNGFGRYIGSLYSEAVNAYLLNQTGNPTDTKIWSIQNIPTTGDFRIRALNDAESNGINAIVLSRTGISSVALNFNGAVTIDGSLRINGQSSATAGGSSGQHLIINLDGTTYKIALLNP